MILVTAKQIPCSVCGAAPGEQCTYVYGPGGARQRKFRFGCHSRRSWDAHDTQAAVNMLLDQ